MVSKLKRKRALTSDKGEEEEEEETGVGAAEDDEEEEEDEGEGEEVEGKECKEVKEKIKTAFAKKEVLEEEEEEEEEEEQEDEEEEEEKEVLEEEEEEQEQEEEVEEEEEEEEEEDQKKSKSQPSAATLKTKMCPLKLQNPIRRKIIWNNIIKMMKGLAYKPVLSKPEPSETEELLPGPKGFLGMFHYHFEKEGCEPVYVMFCSRAGEPTLKSLQYPSKHILLVSDNVTGRARTVLQNLPLRAPPKQCHSTDLTPLQMTDVFVEVFESKNLLFDILNHRYLKGFDFAVTEGDSLQKVFNTFEQAGDKNNFPKMMDYDPLARYMCLAPGTVLGKKGISTSAGEHSSYRVVISQNRN